MSSAAQESNQPKPENPSTVQTNALDRLDSYFASETAKLGPNSLSQYQSLSSWQSERVNAHAQLLDMLGLNPFPEKTPLQAEFTHQVERDGVVVENIHFQSRPGLYVTANLYRPVEVKEKLPAILYVCGHGAVKEDGVSFGNKVHYHHHGMWFAKNGYVCLTIDTLQLGEIEGLHHGTYRHGMWWWLNRGYTPAGVEAWNCIRAIDFLETLPNVDAARIGVTGRSGGGAYSWWIAAIDERIRCAVPVAGITDLHNHVVDDCVEGHCDCMFMVNRYRWDYSKVAALVAPRPLLISNSDQDPIFPLDGVARVHQEVAMIYSLYGASDKLGLNITSGPHQDTQNLRVSAYRWFEKHLKGNSDEIDSRSPKAFSKSELQVFRDQTGDARLPNNELNTTIHETFVPTLNSVEQGEILPPAELQDRLLDFTFRGWPSLDIEPKLEELPKLQGTSSSLRTFRLTTQDHVSLRLILLSPEAVAKPNSIELHLLDDSEWKNIETSFSLVSKETDAEANSADGESAASQFKSLIDEAVQERKWIAFFAPRGMGHDAWEVSERQAIHLQRRFYLLGQTLDGMRVWDTYQAARAVKNLAQDSTTTLSIQAKQQMATIALYASLFFEEITEIKLVDMPADHQQGPFLLNIDRVSTIVQVVGSLSRQSKIDLSLSSDDKLDHFRALYERGVSPRALFIKKVVQ